ncbi:hypothetical protein F8B43_0921 [Methylorubrum populi]|uniref:Uncharacterized protein n=1 Tax=Methylorubrum populi TaxID=223967 RepID=A0A833JBB7_9HYPH|nr:hypothetical protein F8B43_0921 [Methylorubrum populi]
MLRRAFFRRTGDHFVGMRSQVVSDLIASGRRLSVFTLTRLLSMDR